LLFLFCFIRLLEPSTLKAIVHANRDGRTIENVSSDGSVELRQLSEMMPPTNDNADNIETWSNFMENSSSVFGDDTEAIKSLTCNNKEYEKKKLSSMVQFFKILQRVTHFALLVQLVDDDNGGKILRFFKLLRGEKSEEKKKVINAVCMAVVMHYRMAGYEDTPNDPNGVYQPNSTDTFLKHVFRVFREQGIQYMQSDIRNIPGSYAAYLAKKWEETLKVRSDFANKPMQATTVMDDVEKLQHADPPLDPFRNYNDLLVLVLWLFFKGNQSSCWIRGTSSLPASSHLARPRTKSRCCRLASAQLVRIKFASCSFILFVRTLVAATFSSLFASCLFIWIFVLTRNNTHLSHTIFAFCSYYFL
jgi:hypothetical protein